jgi:pyrimidine operon attenuation protein/uracil phosphoribosyltransferase
VASDPPVENSQDDLTPRASPGVVLDDVAIRRCLMRIAHEIVERNDDLARLYLVATPTGGPPRARRPAPTLRAFPVV